VTPSCCRFLAIGLLWLGANSLAAEISKADENAFLEMGRGIYNFHCYFCHGYSGDAATLAATYLDPPPRNFKAAAPEDLTLRKMLDAVTYGVSGTGMKPFQERLSPQEIQAVVHFVREEFLLGRKENTRYHTPENGWPNHERYVIAFPFATGQIGLETPWVQLSKEQRRGKRLFLASCVTCHDHGHVPDRGHVWESRPLSYPRAGYSHRPESRVDATSSATPYAVHDLAPDLPENASASVTRGRDLFQTNCAFCHAADGTGRNWIGSFLEPSPRDLGDPEFLSVKSDQALREAIVSGLPGTSMPSWRHVLNSDDISSIIVYMRTALRRPASSDRDPATKKNSNHEEPTP